MNEQLTMVDRVAAAVLYEGYVLYPYRRSIKNQQRWTFGGVFPRSYAEGQVNVPWVIHTECLLTAAPESLVTTSVRFLQPLLRRVAQPADESAEGPELTYVDVLECAGQRYETWQEARERRIDLPESTLAQLAQGATRVDFAFPETQELENLFDENGTLAGVLVREQKPLRGVIELKAAALEGELYRLSVNIENVTPLPRALSADRNTLVMQALVSTHTILSAPGGSFISLIDPPESLRSAAAACRNQGAWPVLVGEAGQSDTMLAAPIILYDYPQIAAESAGELFDGTEIDEILNLRIQTLTDEEKRQMAALEGQTRALLERAESLSAGQFAALHGTWRAAPEPSGRAT